MFILNINSSPFPASGDAISHPLYAAVDKSAPYFTAIRHDNPTLPESLHESINQRYDHSLTLLVVVVVLVLVADCACPLSTVTVYFLMS